jgi:hypothetical protein
MVMITYDRRAMWLMMMGGSMNEWTVVMSSLLGEERDKNLKIIISCVSTTYFDTSSNPCLQQPATLFKK